MCSIMDRTGDVAELLVEHASDFRMCDLLEDNPMPQLTNPNASNVVNSSQRKSSDVIGLVAGEFRKNSSSFFNGFRRN